MMYSTDAGLQRLAVALAVGDIPNDSAEMKNLWPEARATVEQSAASIQEVKIARMRRDMILPGNTGIRYRYLKAGRWRDEANHKARLGRWQPTARLPGYQRPTPRRDQEIALAVLHGATCAEVGRQFGLTSTRINQITKIGRPRPRPS